MARRSGWCFGVSVALGVSMVGSGAMAQEKYTEDPWEEEDPGDPSEADVLPVLVIYGGAGLDYQERRGAVAVPAVGINAGAAAEVWHKEGGSWGVWITPEIGWGARLFQRGEAEEPFHAGMLSFGAGVGNRWAFVSAQPRLYFGEFRDEFAAIVSHGITGHFLLEIIRLEAAHELFISEYGTKNMLTGTVSFDLVITIMALANM